MFDRIYRRRLDADIARWQAEGAITAQTGDAIRRALGPAPEGIGVATIVGIVGALLIAAAFLAFVAANWLVIPRPVRLAVLLAAIAAAHGLGALFARQQRPHLADAAIAVGAIVFGAAIALVGQMYHLSSDFAAGLLLWASGALAGALLTGSRGALAVALAAGCAWSFVSTFDLGIVPHWPFLVPWAAAAALALAWNAPSARHLASLSLAAWWVATAVGLSDAGFADPWRRVEPAIVLTAGAALMLGAGLAAGMRGPAPLRLFGATMATYGAFGLALILAFLTVAIRDTGPAGPPGQVSIGLVAAALAGLAALGARRIGTALAGAAASLALVAAALFPPPLTDASRWLVYALSLAASLCLVLSGALDLDRPRLVAGWIGLGLVIAGITWAAQGTLLMRALFLAIAGGAAIMLALALGRLSPKEAVS